MGPRPPSAWAGPCLDYEKLGWSFPSEVRAQRLTMSPWACGGTGRMQRGGKPGAVRAPVSRTRGPWPCSHWARPRSLHLSVAAAYRHPQVPQQPAPLRSPVRRTVDRGVEVVRLRCPRQVQQWKRQLKGPAESRSQGAAHNRPSTNILRRDRREDARLGDPLAGRGQQRWWPAHQVVTAHLDEESIRVFHGGCCVCG